MIQDNDAILTALFWSMLAGLGGAVKYVATVIRSSEVISNRKFISMIFANVFISSFCGLMGGLLLQTLTQDPIWGFLASGIFGYIGTTSIDYVIIALQKKILIHPKSHE